MEKIKIDGRKKIILFDTTLRDGHQCPWAAIERDEDYFRVVRGLDSVGFDICEVGFPSSSPHEAWRVKEVAQMVKNWEINTIVWGLTQMVDFQVESTLRALEPAWEIGKGFFHIYFPVDPALRQASIGTKVSDQEALKNVAKFSRIAKDSWLIVQFSPEWYSKVGTNFDFCTELLIAAAENGTTYFNTPDTIWGEDPDNTTKEYYVNTILRHKALLDEKFPGNNFIWSVHNHNDLGNAVQNSINGVKQTGISKIEWTINGIGERAGNADLNQIITRMKTTLSHMFDLDHINASKIHEVSGLVSSLMLPLQPNYPIVGSNAMRHTSGWHTNAMIKNPTVYQPFDPNLVWGSISLVYWPNSWGNLAVEIIEKNGFKAPKEKEEKRKLDEYLKSKMQETGRYKWITDEELLELYFDYMFPIFVHSYDSKKEAETKIFSFEWSIFWSDKIEISWKTPLSALKQIIDQHMPWFTTKDYHSNEEGQWIDAIAIGSIKIIWDIGEYKWTWKDQDIEMAAILALLDAYKKYYIEKELRQVNK